MIPPLPLRSSSITVPKNALNIQKAFNICEMTDEQKEADNSLSTSQEKVKTGCV